MRRAGGRTHRRWWLGLQVSLALAGCAVWLTGAILEQDFVAGVGCGLLLGALALRFGREATAEAGRASREAAAGEPRASREGRAAEGDAPGGAEA